MSKDPVVCIQTGLSRYHSPQDGIPTQPMPAWDLLLTVKSGCADFLHFGHEMAHEVLDAVPQRRCRGWTARARPLHVEIEHAVAKAPEGNVAAICGHCRANTGLEQILDG